MLAYAATAPRFAERRSSPNALLAIIAGHVALLAVVMSAKMDLPRRLSPERPFIFIPVPNPPPPPPTPMPQSTPRPQPSPTVTEPHIPVQPLPGSDLSPTPAFPDPGPVAGNGPVADPMPLPKPVPIHLGPQLLTSPDTLKPPYPATKLASGEEAALQLRLTIDERGRVVAVEPVGRADPVFLAAARRHMLAHWRYRPASEDGRAVSSTVVITLRFQLDG
jgi:protein TonB